MPSGSGRRLTRWALVLWALVVCLLVLGSAASVAAQPASPWVWPLAGVPPVARGFDPPAERWMAGHRGADLRASPGAQVRAAGPGRVSFAGPLAGRGVVVVTHADGTRTTYEPVLTAVAVGEQVRAGQDLGRLAGTGGHCMPAVCLHWGWLRGRVYLDPLLLVRRGPARLLPVWSGIRDGRPPLGELPGSRDPRSGSAARAAPLQRPGSDPPTAWRLAAAAAGLPIALAGAAALRRRGQSNAGSSAASRV